MAERQEIRFSVPLPARRGAAVRRKKELTFRLDPTVAEEEGCMKLKPAVDDDGNEYLMKLLLRDELRSLPEHDAVRQRINTEIAVLKLLDHKHIIKLFQVFATTGRVYVLTEACAQPQHTLRAELEGGSLPLAPDAARVYFGHLLSATGHLHARGLAHRAISPDSAVLDRGVEMLKLSAFHSACPQSGRELLRDAPHAHSDAGRAFQAPEVRAAEEYNGKMADVWSCGAVLRWMLTGAAPPADGDPVAPPAGASLGLAEGLLRRALAADWRGDGDDGCARYTIAALREHMWVAAGGARKTSDVPAPLSRDAVRRSFKQVSAVTGVDDDDREPTADRERTADPDTSVDASGMTDGSPGGCVDGSFSPLPGPERGKPRKKADVHLMGTPDKRGEIMPHQDRTPCALDLSPPDPASPASRTRQLLAVDVAPIDVVEDAEVHDSEVQASPMGRAARDPRSLPATEAVAGGDGELSVVAAAIERVVRENEGYMERVGLEQILADLIVFLLGAKPEGAAKYDAMLRWARGRRTMRGRLEHQVNSGRAMYGGS